MANCEIFLEHTLTRRQLLRSTLGGAASLLLVDSRPVIAVDAPRVTTPESTSPIVVKTELTTEMSQRFGIVFPESDIPEGRDLPLYSNFYRALQMYESAGITDFSNNHTGNLHLVVNSEGKALSGKIPFKSAVGYYWNDGISQLVFNWPKESLPTWWEADRDAPKTSIEAFYNERATIYALHELFHPLQHKTIGSTPEYNHSRVILTPNMQDFAQATGITVVSTSEEIETKPPWQLSYEHQKTEPWAEALKQFDWRFGDGTNPIVEGSTVALSQFLWNRNLFTARFPNLAIWAEREVDHLTA